MYPQLLFKHYFEDEFQIDAFREMCRPYLHFRLETGKPLSFSSCEASGLAELAYVVVSKTTRKGGAKNIPFGTI